MKEKHVLAYLDSAKQRLAPLLNERKPTREPVNWLWNRALARKAYTLAKNIRFGRSRPHCKLGVRVDTTFVARPLLFSDLSAPNIRDWVAKACLTELDIQKITIWVQYIQNALDLNITTYHKAAYYPSWDNTIELPWILTFNSTETLWSTFFHELAHWTGGPYSGRPREYISIPGTDSDDLYRRCPEYGKEEAVAELTSLALCNTLKMLPDPIECGGIRYINRFLHNVPKVERSEALEFAVGEAGKASLFLIERLPELFSKNASVAA